MSLSNGIVSGTSAIAAFTADSVLDTDANEIQGLVNKMAGNSYGMDATLGFKPAVRQF